ncbi:MAG: hypothetical protein RJA70_5024, partial [Pseudomonadota bacterium]
STPRTSATARRADAGSGKTQATPAAYPHGTALGGFPNELVVTQPGQAFAPIVPNADLNSPPA